jgi:hypothetical protein
VTTGSRSPPVVVKRRERQRALQWGNPDPDYISTSYVERGNLTMRMGMRRLSEELCGLLDPDRLLQ